MTYSVLQEHTIRSNPQERWEYPQRLECQEEEIFGSHFRSWRPYSCFELVPVLGAKLDAASEIKVINLIKYSSHEFA